MLVRNLFPSKMSVTCYSIHAYEITLFTLWFCSSTLSRKWYTIRPWLQWNANRKPYPSFEWYHFQWPWTTPNPDFKVTPLFNAEYLRNGKR